MSSDNRYACDTNVIISALLFHSSVPGRTFTAALDDGTILSSQSLIEELSEVMAREKFDRYVSREERDRFLEAFIHESELVEITESVQECRDPKDDRLLELAINGKASYLVTGDADLLVLHPFRGIPVVTPSTLLASLDAPSTASEP